MSWPKSNFGSRRRFYTERLADTFYDFITRICLVDGTPGDAPDIERRREFKPENGPFRTVAVLPVWRTDTVLGVARMMAASGEFSALPILADALEDAGCEDETLLACCRDSDAVRFCGGRVVDLILGKESAQRPPQELLRLTAADDRPPP